MADRSVRLFLSCVSDEFGAYRDALRHALTRPNVEVKIQEDFKTLGLDTLHMLEEYIEQCDAVVHFLGDMAGSSPPASSVEDMLARRPALEEKLAKKGLSRETLAELTYTQWEAWLAVAFDKSLLIVEAAPDIDRGAKYAPTNFSRQSQSDHLKRLEAIDRHPILFTSADNLRAEILEHAVIDALVSARATQLTGTTTLVGIIGALLLLVPLLLGQVLGDFPIFIRVLAAVAGSLFVWFSWRYWEILGDADEPLGSRKRADYDALLNELQSGGTPAKIYRGWLTEALDRVDIFFGDPGRNDKSWFPRAFGLETPGARWTAPAFDRCMLLAIVYPIVTIVAAWVWSGHIGVAERALGLWESPFNLPSGFRRAAYGLSLAAIPYAGWQFLEAKSLVPRFLWVAVSIGACHVVFDGVFGGGASAAGFAVSVGVPFASAIAVARAGGLAGALAVGSVVEVGIGGAKANAVAVTVAAAVFGAAIAAGAAAQYVKTGRKGAFLLLFFLAASVAAFLGVWLSASSLIWPQSGPVLLVFGVLALVIAPFVWFAVGLTRAFLRRGLAPGGRGPFFYAFVDAIVAPLVVALLAVIIVFAVQTFDDIAEMRAGEVARIMEPGPLFEGLEARDPKFSWVWLMLLSPLIPSVINLCVAAASFLRGLPFLNAWIVRKMPDTIQDSDRVLLASALGGQVAAGALLTGVVLYLIGVWLLPLLVPILGFIREVSEGVANYDAPRRIMTWFVNIR